VPFSYLENLQEEEEEEVYIPRRSKKSETITQDVDIPQHHDFLNHPGHTYWKWDIQAQGWYHTDRKTGKTTWAPTAFS